MQCGNGRGATLQLGQRTGAEPRAHACARLPGRAQLLWAVGAALALGATGLLGCGGTPDAGPTSNGGAGGSDPPHGNDASHDDDARRDGDAPATDTANADGRPELDSGGATDGRVGDADAWDGASAVDTGAVDAPLDGAIDATFSDRPSLTDTVSTDARAEASTDASTDVGTSVDGGACGCAAYAAPVATGTEPSSLTELSGVVASRRHPGVLYAHNDSGSNSTVVAMSDLAAPLGQIVLTNVTAVDWEDVAVGPCDTGSCVFVGDIGDNNLAYASRAIYRFAEPDISPTSPVGQLMVTADVLSFVYPDGRHNAETLLVEPTSGDIFVITKVSNVASTVYRVPKPFTPGTQATLEKVGDLSLPGSAGLVTGGDVHPCGTRMLIRTYPMIYEFTLSPGQPFASIFATPGTPVSTPTQDQESKGEGVTYAADGVGYFTASELDGKASRSLFRIRCQ